jgi:hypothetical protein
MLVMLTEVRMQQNDDETLIDLGSVRFETRGSSAPLRDDPDTRSPMFGIAEE